MHDEFSVSNLRPMVESDLESVRRWRNHPDVRRYMLTSHEIEHEEHVSWFAGASVDPSRRLLIFRMAGAAMGFVQFLFHSAVAAEWGFYLSPLAKPGTGRKLGEVALAYGFGELGLGLISGKALADNLRSLAFHRSLGFVEVASPKRTEGSVEMIFFELTRQEWRNDRKR